MRADRNPLSSRDRTGWGWKIIDLSLNLQRPSYSRNTDRLIWGPERYVMYARILRNERVPDGSRD